MRFRIQFGIREFIAGIIGAVVYYALSILQFNLFLKESLTFGEFVYMPGVWAVIVSAIFGPMTGAVSGMAGQMMANVYVYGNVEALSVIAIIIIALAIGRMQKTLGILDGAMVSSDLVDFNVIHLMVSLLTLLFMRPLLSFFVDKGSLIDRYRPALKVTFGNFFVVLLLGTPILFLVNACMKKYIFVSTLHGKRR